MRNRKLMRSVIKCALAHVANISNKDETAPWTENDTRSLNAVRYDLKDLLNLTKKRAVESDGE